MIWLLIIVIIVVGYFTVRAINKSKEEQPKNEYDGYTDYENRRQNEELRQSYENLAPLGKKKKKDN